MSTNLTAPPTCSTNRDHLKGFAEPEKKWSNAASKEIHYVPSAVLAEQCTALWNIFCLQLGVADPESLQASAGRRKASRAAIFRSRSPRSQHA